MKRNLLFLACVLAVGVAACRREPPAAGGASPSKPLSSSSPQSPAGAPAPVAPLPDEMSAILDAYRKIIVLLEDGRELQPADQPRAEVAGRILYQQKHQQVSTLIDAISADLAARPARMTRLNAFLDALESNGELHDADKLAFRDVVDEVADDVGQSGGDEMERLRTRLQEDSAALTGIQALYQKELEKIFGRFDTRGMQVRREAWEAYVGFLRTRYKAAAILQEHASELEQVTSARVETALETSGTRLPAKSLVLTFDDGPHAKRTDLILAILKRFGVKAVFFEVGQNVAGGARESHPTQAAAAAHRVIEAGHTIGNHSYTHALLLKLNDRQIAEQIERTNRALDGVSPARMSLFRAPYGAKNQNVLAAVEARHMKSVLWNVDSKDWADPIPLSIANRVVQAVDGEKRGILLFHDIQKQTVEALPVILETLQARGYRFLSWNGTSFVDETPASAPVEAAQAAPPLYRESWAVVVGIDAYQHWPRLSFAANDARGVSDLLIKRYGFAPDHVTILLNEEATRAKILEVLGDRLADPSRVKKEDRVFVFFAGHGATRTLPNGRSLGYIIPADADVTNYQSQAISMTNFQDVSDAIPAKHVLFITDACYGGLALTRGGSQSYLQQVTRRVARQMLTAGGADEQVADNGPNGHSIFTWTLMQGLEGRGDLNGDGFITASELAAYTGPIVSSLSRQTPAFGALAGSEGGEFVFQLSHETEFLSDASEQLEQEAITLNKELERLRAAIAAKRARNDQLKSDIERARAEAEGAPPPPPTSADANDRGMTFFREKRYAEALTAFQEAAAKAPASALALNNVGFTYFKLGRFQESADWFERTLKLDPSRAIAHANLGDAYYALKEPAKARPAYERYLQLQPNGKYAPTVRTRLQEIAR
jgi:peptidoglycan/xylan/chitin deacetylase (PgdA/CDA1 family)/uncharacterized caspase-like protein